MKAFVILAVAACAQASFIAPYAGLPLAYNGLNGINGIPVAYNGLNAINGINGIPVAYNGLNLAAGYAAGYAAPIAAAPIAAPIAPASSQYNSADEFGNINYGYSNINSAKHEQGNTYGGVTGSYSYVDAYGLPQTVNYVADGLGFRVAATNLPVAKSVDLAQPVFDLVGPAPVQDTEEVAAAKAEFQKAFDEATAAASSRKRREILTIPASTQPLALAAPIASPLTYAAAPALAYAGAPALAYAGAPALAYAGAPALAYAGAPIAAAPIAAPVAYTASAPAARDAILTRIQLNPGHATSYIVN